MTTPLHISRSVHLAQRHLDLRAIPINLCPQLRTAPNASSQTVPTAPRMIPHRPLREDVLSRKLQTQTPVRYHGARTMAETVREPNVFGLRAGEAELVAEDLHDGGYAAEG